MRTGRPTQDKKDYNIKLRINSKMRVHIENKCNSLGISMSDYVRTLIQSDICRPLDQQHKAE